MVAQLWRFNSRTREGCDFQIFTIPTKEDVSIHAPGRGATVAYEDNNDLTYVSIHAPGRGAT